MDTRSSRFHPDPGASAAQKTPIVLIGGGGHALVVAEAAELAGLLVVGFLDDNPDAPLSQAPNRVERIGGLGDRQRIGDRAWIVAIGNLAYRDRVIRDLEQREIAHSAAKVIHPQAIVSPSATIHRGAFVGPGAIVHARAVVHEHAIINSGAIIEHECVIASNAHVAPGAVLGGRVHIGENTLVGLGARILPNLSVGDNCTIGAGSIITKSVGDGKTIVGIPGRERSAS